LHSRSGIRFVFRWSVSGISTRIRSTCPMPAFAASRSTSISGNARNGRERRWRRRRSNVRFGWGGSFARAAQPVPDGKGRNMNLSKRSRLTGKVMSAEQSEHIVYSDKAYKAGDMLGGALTNWSYRVLVAGPANQEGENTISQRLLVER